MLGNVILVCLLVAAPILLYISGNYTGLFLITTMYILEGMMLTYYVGRGEMTLFKRKKTE